MNLSDIKASPRTAKKIATAVKSLNKSTTPYLTGANLENYFMAVLTIAGMVKTAKDSVTATRGNVAIANTVLDSAITYHSNKQRKNIVAGQVTKKGALFFQTRKSYDIKEVKKYIKLAKAKKLPKGYLNILVD